MQVKLAIEKKRQPYLVLQTIRLSFKLDVLTCAIKNFLPKLQTISA